MKFLLDPQSVKGFLSPSEGQRLYSLVEEIGALGPCLEIGSYCGKSAIYLGEAARRVNSIVFSIDHHRGSEEHQLGEAYHDSEFHDEQTHLFDTLPAFRKTLAQADLESIVIPVVSSTGVIGPFWHTPLAMVFIDGGHSAQAAHQDYDTWPQHLIPGGYLAIHDVFENPDDGGRPPYEIYCRAIESGQFKDCQMTESLAVLRKI